jgi:hypothetical protein
MDRKNVRQVTPKARGESPVAPFLEKFTPGYVQRALSRWPKQGAKKPWRVYQNYFRDFMSLKWTPIDDTALEFSNPPQRSSNLEEHRTPAPRGAFESSPAGTAG